MSSAFIFWRAIRILVFLLIGTLIIFSSRIPSNFYTQHIFMSALIFAFTAVVIARRPGTANIVSVSILALIYAIYTDEGIALGAFSLIAMGVLSQFIRPIIAKESYIIEWLSQTAIFAIVMLIRNFILTLSFSYHFKSFNMFMLIISFSIAYLLINVLIRIIFRSRIDMEYGTE